MTDWTPVLVAGITGITGVLGGGIGFLIARSQLKQWGRVWTSLHPGQQALISSSDYDVCMDKVTSEDGSYEIKRIKVVDVYDNPLHAVAVNGEWR